MNGVLQQSSRIPLVATGIIGMFLAIPAVGGQAFDLAHAKGMEQFAGSAAARELLARNGFLVWVAHLQPHRRRYGRSAGLA